MYSNNRTEVGKNTTGYKRPVNNNLNIYNIYYIQYIYVNICNI